MTRAEQNLDLFNKDLPIRIGDYIWVEDYGGRFAAIVALIDEDYCYAYRLTDHDRAEVIQRHHHSVEVHMRREGTYIQCCWYYNDSNNAKMTLAYLYHGYDYSRALQKRFEKDHPRFSHTLSSCSKIPDQAWDSMSDHIGSHIIRQGSIEATKVIEEWTGWKFVEGKHSIPFETLYPTTFGEWINTNA